MALQQQALDMGPQSQPTPDDGSGPQGGAKTVPESRSAAPIKAAGPAPNSAATPSYRLPPLQKSTTGLSATARSAADTLASFPTSSANPRNWSNRQKWKITLTVAVTGFISTCGSSIAVPGIHAIMAEFGESNEKVGVLITSFYVLGLGAGPFLFAPISELYGRQVAYLISQFCYFVFCIGTAVCQDMTSLIVLRFFCGVFGSSGPALGVATCADLWVPEERGRPVSIYAIGPMAGPVIGSMLGYWILFGGWRWLFWCISILAGLNMLLFIIVAGETNTSVVEKKLLYHVRHPKEDMSGTSFLARCHPAHVLHELSWMSAMVSRSEAKAVFGRAFSRPPRLFLFNPVCTIFAVYYAYIYGIIYIFLVCVPLLFGSPPFDRQGLFSYMWPQSTISLSYIGLAIGFACAATTAANVQDRIYKYLSGRNDGQGEPEYRLVMTQTGMCLMPLGLLIFGWTAHAEVHWIAPQIGMAIVALGLMLAFNSIQNFIVDAFFPYSAAGVAAATALRSAFACVLPIFAPDMFHDIGWGWGSTLLALIAAAAVPAPMLMFKYGKALREKYKFEG